MASSLIDVCRFNPTAGGTTDWTYSSAVTGYQSPTAAGAVNGATYSYRAESADLTQWEVGTGAYNSGTGVFARTAVLFNSSGGTSKINFSAVPQVAIVALAEDLLPAKGRTTLPTTQVFTSGSGTYTTPTNCLWIEVEMVGGGGGGSGSGTSAGNGTAGSATTFSALTANGGGLGSVAGGVGGTASGGYLNQSGGNGGNATGVTSPAPGGIGGSSAYGGCGPSGVAGAGAGLAATANSGSGGGGGGTNTTANSGAGGGAGGFVKAIINSPAASYSYAVGAAGSAGTAGTGGAVGGAGAAGRIAVTEHYN